MIILEDILGACFCLEEACTAVVASSTAAPLSADPSGMDGSKDEAVVAQGCETCVL